MRHDSSTGQHSLARERYSTIKHSLAREKYSTIEHSRSTVQFSTAAAQGTVPSLCPSPIAEIAY